MDQYSVTLEFEHLPLSQLRHGRRGKHHQLVAAIASQIQSLPDGEAVKIPLDRISVSVQNLRSAVTRAMTACGVKVATSSDGESLFVWKKTPSTKRFERARRGSGGNKTEGSPARQTTEKLRGPKL